MADKVARVEVDKQSVYNVNVNSEAQAQAKNEAYVEECCCEEATEEEDFYEAIDKSASSIAVYNDNDDDDDDDDDDDMPDQSVSKPKIEANRSLLSNPIMNTRQNGLPRRYVNEPIVFGSIDAMLGPAAKREGQ